MKTKSAFSKIKSSSQLIDRFKINEETADNKNRSLFQEFIGIYNEVVQSINEADSLKKALKEKEDALDASIKKLLKIRKSAKKALRSSTKSPVRLINKSKEDGSDLLPENDDKQKPNSDKNKAKRKDIHEPAS